MGNMRERTAAKSGLKIGAAAAVLMTALGAATSVSAQVSPDNVQSASLDGNDQEAAQVDEIVVTGTRIRSGFTAPTPTTVFGAEDLQRRAPVNIADAVNELPQLSAASTPRNASNNTSTGLNNLNALSLRGLGSNRTLVLLDGQRIAPSNAAGTVDINTIPTALVERVDVVTGGASAAYGSDAVAGVVNFILNKRFSGLKGSVSTGVTQRGDDRTFNADLAYGRAFADGRGRLLLSGEYATVSGAVIDEDRDWFQSCNMLTYAVTVRPQRVVTCDVNQRYVAQGGVITSGPLANTQFGAGGAALPFVVGSPVDSIFMVGGNTWYEGDTLPLDAAIERYALFGRASYDFSDWISGSLEASYASASTDTTAAYQRFPGNGSTALTMRVDNPFLPASAALAMGGISTFTYGYSSFDLGKPRNIADRENVRLVGSLNGRFSNGWTWDAYYQYGKVNSYTALESTTNTARFREAIDAVSSGGRIVCRSTLTNPTNGCVPLNIFGVGVADPAAIAYVKGVAWSDAEQDQHAAAATVSGDVLTLPAGALSMAFGVEYRKETVGGTADTLSQTNGWMGGNFKPTVGEIEVKEAFAEVSVPLLRDVAFAQELALNGAVRLTDYSTSGSVNTWKVGATWSPVTDLRLRGTVSRDIRAPNMSELYNAGQAGRLDVIDTSLPSRPNVSITRITSGNINLAPETADTQAFGVVYRPSFLPQFTASVDYYSIDVQDAIGTVSNQQIVDRCVLGEQALCALIVRNSAGQITTILAQPINVAEQKVRGVDFEASFRHDLGAYGKLTLRGLASRMLDFYSVNGGVKTDSLGELTGTTPEWKWVASAIWDYDKITAQANVRGFSDGVYNNNWVTGVDIDKNEIPGSYYVDLSFNYRIRDEGSQRLVAFFNLENLFDRDPEIVAGSSFSALQTNSSMFDAIGRNFRVGLRFQY